MKIITDKFTGQTKGFGFVEMVSEDEARKAISELNSKPFTGKTLTVSEARTQQPGAGFQKHKGGFGKGKSQERPGDNCFGN